MNEVTIYHNPRCQKSRETLKIIHERGVSAKVVEYMKFCPGKMEFKNLLKMLDMTAVELIRKNETVYKDKFKGKELSEDEWINVMLEYPQLIERPIVVKDKRAIIGRPPEQIETLFE